MQSRNELGKLFEEHRQTGWGAEVGCYDGTFSLELAKHYQGKILSIDYFDPADFLYDSGLEERAYYNLLDTRCELVKGRSLDVARTLDDGSLDWVYIDANHSYESANEDIAAWYPKVRSGGIVSGHDYIKNYRVNNVEFGVWRAVDEFCAKHKYEFNIIPDLVSGANFASWWLLKR